MKKKQKKQKKLITFKSLEEELKCFGGFICKDTESYWHNRVKVWGKWYDEVSEIDLVKLLSIFAKPHKKKKLHKLSLENYGVMLSYGVSYDPRFTINRYMDAEYAMHLCYKEEPDSEELLPLATIAFDFSFDMIRSSGEVIKGIEVKQIQGVNYGRLKENKKRITPFCWSYALLSLVVDWAVKHNIPEIRMLPKHKSKWLEVIESDHCFLQYDVTALDMGFTPVKEHEGESQKLNFEEDKLIKNPIEYLKNKKPDYYRLTTQNTFDLNLELLEARLQVPNFDLQRIMDRYDYKKRK